MYLPKLKRSTLIISSSLVLLLAALLISGQIRAYKAKRAALAKQEYTVVVWDIRSEVKVTSTASLMNEQNLSFASEGKITKVNVQIGDQVQAGDVLAELDMDTYYNAIQTAELELAHSELGLEKLLNNDTSLREAQLRSQINETQTSYSIAQEQYTILQQQFQNSLDQKGDQLRQLQHEYELAQKTTNLASSGLAITNETQVQETESSVNARSQTITTLLSELRGYSDDTKDIITTVDKIFWVSSEYQNLSSSYEQKLSTKNTELKRLTKTNIGKAYNMLWNIERQLTALSTQSSDDELYDFIQNYYQTSEILIELCSTASDALDMTNPSGELSASDIANFSADVTAAKAAASTLRSQLQWLATSVNSLLSTQLQEWQLNITLQENELAVDRQYLSLQQQADSIAQLEDEINILTTDQQNKLAQQQAQINTLRQSISLLQQELSDLLDGADSFDISQQQNLIEQSKLRLERIKNSQEDYQIIADFDGRVRTVDIVEWEQYKLDDRKYIVVENPNLIELKLQVSQIDIVKIHPGDPVTVTFDAYPHTAIASKVASRNVNPQPNGRWWVYYEATIVLERQEQEILAGMTALVSVITASADDALIIPTLALMQKWDKQFVLRKSGKDYLPQEVEIGVMNNFQVQVLSWLAAGDIIKSSVLDDATLHEMWIDDASDSLFGN